MAKNLGTLVGALIGGAVGYLAAKKYEIPLYVAFGPAAYPLAVGIGLITGGIAGKKLYNQK